MRVTDIATQKVYILSGLKARWDYLVLLAVSLVHIFNAFYLVRSVEATSFAYPYLLNRQFVLFDTLYEARGPLRTLLLTSLEALTGQAYPLALRLLDLALALIITWLIFRLTKQLSQGSRLAASTAVVIWLIWYPIINYIVFYFDAALSLTAIAAISLYVFYLQRETRAVSPAVMLGIGALLGAGAFFKQNGILLLPAVIVFHLFAERRQVKRAFADVTLIAVSAVAVALLIFLQLGTLLPLEVALEIARQPGLAAAWQEGNALIDAIFIGAVSIGSVAYIALSWRRMPLAAFFVLLSALSLAGHTTTNFYFRYLSAGLPILCVLWGMGVYAAVSRRARLWLAVLLIAFIGSVRIGLTAYGQARQTHAPGEWVAYSEYQPIAQALQEIIAPDKTFFIFPIIESNAQLLALTEREVVGVVAYHANGWPVKLFLEQNLIARTMQLWERQPPDYILLFPDLLSHEYDPSGWASGKDQINQAFLEYIAANCTSIRRFPEVTFLGEAILHACHAASNNTEENR